MSTHVLTPSGIKNIIDVEIMVSQNTRKKAIEGWVCTVTNTEGVPIEWKPFMSTDTGHPAFTVYQIPHSVAVSLTMAVSTSGKNTVKILPHPTLDDHFISVRLVPGQGVTPSDLRISIFNGLTGAFLSSVSMNRSQYYNLFGYGLYTTGSGLTSEGIFDEKLTAIDPFLYKYDGQWHIGVNIDYLPEYAGNDDRSFDRSVNYVRATASPGGTVLADVSTRAYGSYYHGALSYQITSNGTGLTYRGKLFDYNSNKYYLGPIDQMARPTAKPANNSQRQLFFSLGAKLYSNVVATNSRACMASWQASSNDAPANMALQDMDMITPFSGLNLNAHSKHGLMPGFRGLEFVYGFTDAAFRVRRDTMRFIPGGIGQSAAWVRNSAPGFHATKRGDAPLSSAVRRNDTASDMQIVMGSDDKPYMVLATFTVMDPADYPSYPIAGGGTSAPLDELRTRNRGVITVTVFDIEAGHEAMVNPKQGTTGYPWYRIVRAHTSEVVGGADWSASVVNRSFPQLGLRGFKLAVEPALARDGAGGNELFYIAITGLGRLKLVNPNTLPPGVDLESLLMYRTQVTFPTAPPTSEPANIPTIDLAINAISYQVGDWARGWVATQYPSTAFNNRSEMIKQYGRDYFNFSPDTGSHASEITVPFRNTWSKEMPLDPTDSPGTKLGYVSIKPVSPTQLDITYKVGRINSGSSGAGNYSMTTVFFNNQTTGLDTVIPDGLDSIANTDYDYVTDIEDPLQINWSYFSQPIPDRAATDIKNTITFTVFAGRLFLNPMPAYIVSVDLNKLTDTVF